MDFDAIVNTDDTDLQMDYDKCIRIAKNRIEEELF